MVPIGEQGAVFLSALTGPQSITHMKVLIGTAIGWEIDGTELRGILALAFAVPTVAGSYALMIQATDTRGCVQTTATGRLVAVQ